MGNISVKIRGDYAEECDCLFCQNTDFQWCCEKNFCTPTLTIGKKFYPHLAPILGNTVVRREHFGCICTNCYSNVFLRHWGGCLALPQRRWGPLGLHNTTADFVFYRQNNFVSENGLNALKL